MQTRISKTLEGAIARTAFDTAKADINSSLKDYLMLELIRDEGSLAYQILASRLRRREIEQLRLRIGQALKAAENPSVQSDDSANGSGDGVTKAAAGPAQFFTEFADELRHTARGVRNISTAHALLNIAEDPATATAAVLSAYGIGPNYIAGEIARFTSGEGHRLSSSSPAVTGWTGGGDGMTGGFTSPVTDSAQGGVSLQEPQTMLDKFGQNLTRMAREGRIDPVIGRSQEIERVVQILSRRKKNNPILIGEAGVGKSAIVEGLALRMAAGDVPHTIADKELYSLDVSALVAGTKVRGEFEERMQQLLDELRRSDRYIIFIDEIHTIVGAGSSQGSLDTANILKPALSRGELQTIGATTLDEYRNNIERDSALERRFQRVMVEPTTAAQTLEILRSIAPDYERHHRVRYTDEALRACVALTERYITDRHFPDKAIDVMDEAGSRARIAASHEPETIRDVKSALDEARRERREAAEALVYDKAAEARLREMALNAKLSEHRAEWEREMSSNPAEIGASDIAAVITSMTGIPAERVTGGEMERLRGLRDYLASRVIGQPEAVERVSNAIMRSRAGLKDENRPAGVFMFVGPTGVGKTLLAKELSKWLFDDRRGLVRIDMSEYGEKHNVARLIGSPPGYVGYGEGGQLTEAVRRQPYSVVLFDEIEKAHPDVFNAMLQIFDEGRLTDGEGRVVDFRNTVIIMTSNVGSRAAAQRPVHVGYTTRSKEDAVEAAPRDEYQRALEATFAPEFLNRVDDIVFFRTLDIEDIGRIVELELQSVLERAGRLGYKVEVSAEALQTLARRGYESRYGVRSLKRTLAEEVEQPLSALIVGGKLHEGGSVNIEAAGDDSDVLLLRVA